MTKTLTPQQIKFLDAVFTPEAKGDLSAAKKIAGYSDNTKMSEVMTEGVREALAKRVLEFVSDSSTKAAYSLYDVLTGLDDPLGRKERIAVAKDLLDRAGYNKTEKVEVSAPGGLFILPAKDNAED